MEKKYKNRRQVGLAVDSQLVKKLNKESKKQDVSRTALIVKYCERGLRQDKMKVKELYYLNELARKTAENGMNGTQVSEDYLFNHVVKTGEEIDISEPHICFYVSINEVSKVELTIYNNELEEEEIDVTALETRIDNWLNEQEMLSKSVQETEDSLNISER